MAAHQANAMGLNTITGSANMLGSSYNNNKMIPQRGYKLPPSGHRQADDQQSQGSNIFHPRGIADQSMNQSDTMSMQSAAAASMLGTSANDK